MIQRVIIAGGGTGGHLFPGIAVGEELRRRCPELEVLFVGTERGIEARVIPELGERLECLDVRPLMGRSPAQLGRNLLAVPGALGQAAGLVRRFRPDVCIGVGGYSAGPMLLAAAMLGVPTALLEQNAHVGLTNRLLSRWVGRAYLSFEETRERFGIARSRVVGNPVRRSFVEMARAARVDPEGFEARARQILVLGGSQGARSLNERVPEALARLDLTRWGYSVLHQTGPAMVDAVRRDYEARGVPAQVVPFIDDMARAYASASLVIARAGATTVAELCAVGRPSVLIPYPHAAEDHQAKNAMALEQAGAAIAIREQQLDPERLADQVRGLIEQPDQRRRMTEAARRCGRPDAAAAIVDDLCAWLGCPEQPASDTSSRTEGASSVSPAGGSSGHTRGTTARRRPRVCRTVLRVYPVEGDTLQMAASRAI